MEENADLKRHLGLYQNMILSKRQTYPLDYIVHLPEILRDRKHPSKKIKQMVNRRNILKNVVFRRIIEIREIKKQPKLSGLLAMFKDIRTNPEAREKLIQKLTFLYDTNKAGFVAKQDIKYERLMSSFDRIRKILQVQGDAFDSIDIKMTKLLKRRQEREKLGAPVEDYYRKMIQEKLS